MQEDEIKKEIARESRRRYKASAKGKAANQKYNRSEKGKALRRKFFVSVAGSTHALFHSARQRARKHGRAFSITKEWIEERLEAGVCEVTGVKFSYDKKEYNTAPFAPSLDRVVGSKGYTKENTQVVCNFYNILKWEWNPTDLKKILKVLKTLG